MVTERVADPNFTNVDLTAMAAQMEIVSSRWSRTNGAWSQPVALTVNNVLDHAPLLCRPMSDRSVLAVWTRNQQNLLIGTNGAGTDDVWWARWNASNQVWTAPQILVSNVSYRLSQSLSGISNYAVYAWTRDMDGVLTNDTDQEVFYAEYLGGAWSSAKRFTSNSVPDKNVRLVVSWATNSGAVALQEGFETGNFSLLAWSFGGNMPWLVQTSVVQSGSFAAASGTITDNQTSSMSNSMNCASGTVSFGYKVSSESGYDYLRFYIDGTQQGSWSGTVGWSTASYAVSAGQHTFEWRYTKDVSVSSGSDKAWVDNIVFPKAGPPQLVFTVWQQGTNLVMDQNFSGLPQLVRSDSQTAGFADYAATLGPNGNLVLLWQEMTTNGSDAHYMVYDPASATWSKDMLLCADAPLERSFAPVWDDVGNLTVAYNKVEMLLTNKTVTLDDGSTITITNVPQPGRVDLVVTKRALVKDLALLAGDFTIQGVNWLPGDPLTLTALVRNAGDVAVSNVVVGFYDGAPGAGGTLITNVALPGWLEGAGTNTVSTLWVVPEPATNHVLYAVADPAGAVTEFNEANNTQSLSIAGTDLAVSLVSQSAETSGAVRVIAQVQNLGAPTATNTILAIRRNGATTILATNGVPALEPGRLAQVALDLPPGTQPAGDAMYQLSADDTHAVPDVNTNNNTASFAVNLWVDSDGDGIPDNWMVQYFGHATGQAGDLSRAQDDADGDGVSNLAEYLAGTNPKDATSYLKITSLTWGGTNGVQLAWGSSSNRLYSVLRSSVLSTNGAVFTNLAAHILSTPPQNVFFDTTATNTSPVFYRIKVE